MAASHKRIEGVLLTTSLTIADTITGSGVKMTFAEFVLVNNHSDKVDVEIQFVKSAQAPDNKYRVVATQPETNQIPKGESRTYTFRPMLGVGDTIRWKASVADVVSASVGYILEGA